MITVNKPYITKSGSRSRCNCDISVDGENRTVWFEVDEAYEQYLVTERADAYVVGLLHWCMLHGHDIKCLAPVTDELLYNITTILIPSLAKYAKDLNAVKIEAETAPALPGKEIGTGCSCGIDSFDAIYQHYKTDFPTLDLTYLCINNVGAFNECYDEYGRDKVKEERYQKVDSVAEELGLPIIKTDSNFADAFPQNHLFTATYSSVFAIYMMQKFWKIYYYASSGIDYGHFSLSDRECAHYDLLSLQCFSTSGLIIYSEGGEKERIDKTRDIVDFKPAQKYLHVCLTKPYNCGRCSKCQRTLLTLDYLNKLDNFKEVFDIDYYKENRVRYYKLLAYLHSMGNRMNEPVYQGMLSRPEFKKIADIEKIKNPLRKVKKKVLKK